MQSKINEIGRSMVEMLGVLAVIGILSVGGIMGYKFAMLKYRVNETVNELNIRTNEIYQYFSVQENENLPTQTVGAEIKMSLGETMRTGYPIVHLFQPITNRFLSWNFNKLKQKCVNS